MAAVDQSNARRLRRRGTDSVKACEQYASVSGLSADSPLTLHCVVGSFARIGDGVPENPPGASDSYRETPPGGFFCPETRGLDRWAI